MATLDRSTIEWLLGLDLAVNQQLVIALLKGKTKEELEELLNSKDVNRNVRDDEIFLDEDMNFFPVILTASIYERTLPIVKVSLVLRGVDNDDSTTAQEILNTTMLWDTGAQSTLISKDLLSDAFRAYLNRPQHDPYRNNDATRVQIEVRIAFSNLEFELVVIGYVVPKGQMPNQTSFIIFGQP
ncbi:hypothetical protein V496_05181 [Pseudogymnoascus sp. VKM F-4515 (FW-2607)]|nr:hypothetical protein V496_05181 [Pseudogymnoascus sp. VKM F-4515 (FW-2607)]KFY92970.1 hypothetical protein V498_04640 [Pseudogymnoascus sp. VKM F-4517 (FW-2822)]